MHYRPIMRRTLLLLAAVLVAAFGTSLVYLYVRGADARALGGQEIRSVLVATQTLRAGTAADALDATPRDLPAIAVVDGAISDPKEVAGKVLTVQVVKGEQLTTAMFSAKASKVSAGQAAVSVEISDVNRVPALLTAGDTVDVYAKRDGKLQSVLSRVVVYQVGGKDAGGKALSPSIVTFVLDASDAVDLAAAQASGNEIVLIMVSASKM